jgi:hypothetical protein
LAAWQRPTSIHGDRHLHVTQCTLSLDVREQANDEKLTMYRINDRGQIQLWTTDVSDLLLQDIKLLSKMSP